MASKICRIASSPSSPKVLSMVEVSVSIDTEAVAAKERANASAKLSVVLYNEYLKHRFHLDFHLFFSL